VFAARRLGIGVLAMACEFVPAGEDGRLVQLILFSDASAVGVAVPARKLIDL